MELSRAEQDVLRAFLASVFGNQANSWPMNDGVFNETYKMLQESRKCSDLMDLVPRPMGVGSAPVKYVKKSVRSILLRKLKNSKNHYKVCVSVSSAKAKSKITMAALGL